MPADYDCVLQSPFYVTMTVGKEVVGVRDDCIMRFFIVCAHRRYFVGRGGVRTTRGLGPTMTARGQSIRISIGMLPQTLIMSRLDQFQFFIIHKIFPCLWTTVFFIERTGPGGVAPLATLKRRLCFLVMRKNEGEFGVEGYMHSRRETCIQYFGQKSETKRSRGLHLQIILKLVLNKYS